MILKQFNKLIEKYNIPDDIIFQSDTGWECGYSDLILIAYNEKEKRIVFLSDTTADYDYYHTKNWQILEE